MNDTSDPNKFKVPGQESTSLTASLGWCSLLIMARPGRPLLESCTVTKHQVAEGAVWTWPG
jgi:hypothetical protein